ncbi:hypothetical protein [Hyalangium sp.]|uniref:hypothetical protein n=1 Tax=Hyalangium sp. TaxID=2028555 RepID=UPI002D5FA484|nr:hypothetical protein [Hyalangium sp.]HYH95220.1 hypothetical protein [Hyalangium sp.]
MRQGIRRPGRPLPPWGFCLLLALGALPARAATLIAELSASQDSRAWTLLGDVELREDSTFLTFGYSGLIPGPDTAPTHQLSLGVDQALSDHWLVSGGLIASLPKTTLTPLAREMPRLGLPALGARTSYSSQGLALSAGYDSGGLSDVEYGLDVGVGLTRYPLRRALVSRREGEQPRVIFQREEQLGVLRPSLGARLLLGAHWELGLRGGLYLYSDDPLSTGQFSEEEQQALAERYAQVGDDRPLQRTFLEDLYRDLGSAVAGRLGTVTGLPSAPARFEVKPSVTWILNSTVRGQLSYAFTGYVPGQGHGHLLATRWTFRLGEPVRLWASVALQVDVPEESDPFRTGLATLGAEYTF